MMNLKELFLPLIEESFIPFYIPALALIASLLLIKTEKNIF